SVPWRPNCRRCNWISPSFVIGFGNSSRHASHGPSAIVLRKKPKQIRVETGLHCEVFMRTAAISNLTAKTLEQDFEELFRQHHQLVCRTAYSITGRVEDAEDVLQILFLKLMQRGLPPGFQKNPKGYLYRAAVNASLDLVRARNRR